MTKMGQRLIKIAQKSRCFCTFSVFVLLKFWGGGGLGGTALSVIVGLTQGSHAIAEPMARKRSTGQKTVSMTRQSL